MPQEPALRPLSIKVHPHDTVAIIANEGGLRAGVRLDSGLTLLEDIPEAHKVALIDIEAGEPILRFGSVIGYANQFIARGSWIHEGRMRLPAPPLLHDLPIRTAPSPALDPIEGCTFEGFLNADATVGTKNILGITTTVQCVAPTVEFAVRRIKAEILPRYRNVDDVIALTHNYGCGVAIDAPGAEIPIRTLRNLCRNPNLGGEAMVVSLGCEKLQPARLLPDDALPVLSSAPSVMRMQDEQYRSFADIVTAIMEMAEKRLATLDRRRRTVRPASDLVV